MGISRKIIFSLRLKKLTSSSSFLILVFQKSSKKDKIIGKEINLFFLEDRLQNDWVGRWKIPKRYHLWRVLWIHPPNPKEKIEELLETNFIVRSSKISIQNSINESNLCLYQIFDPKKFCLSWSWKYWGNIPSLWWRLNRLLNWYDVGNTGIHLTKSRHPLKKLSNCIFRRFWDIKREKNQEDKKKCHQHECAKEYA